MILYIYNFKNLLMSSTNRDREIEISFFIEGVRLNFTISVTLNIRGKKKEITKGPYTKIPLA